MFQFTIKNRVIILISIFIVIVVGILIVIQVDDPVDKVPSTNTEQVDEQSEDTSSKEVEDNQVTIPVSPIKTSPQKSSVNTGRVVFAITDAANLSNEVESITVVFNRILIHSDSLFI